MSLRERAESVGGAALEELTSIEAELVTKVAERATVASQIDPDVLELYEDLRKQKKGIGAVALPVLKRSGQSAAAEAVASERARGDSMASRGAPGARRRARCRPSR